VRKQNEKKIFGRYLCVVKDFDNHTRSSLLYDEHGHNNQVWLMLKGQTMGRKSRILIGCFCSQGKKLYVVEQEHHDNHIHEYFLASEVVRQNFREVQTKHPNKKSTTIKSSQKIIETKKEPK
jgi:hypothetical protein